jgi:hypothetical protein
MYSEEFNVENTVSIINTKRKVEAFAGQKMNAPHVFADGHLCYGNITFGMIEAYKSRNLFDMIMQLIIFLQSANLDDAAGKYLTSWPEVSEDVALNSDKTNIEIVKKQINSVEKKFDDMLNSALNN